MWLESDIKGKRWACKLLKRKIFTAPQAFLLDVGGREGGGVSEVIFLLHNGTLKGNDASLKEKAWSLLYSGSLLFC